MIAFDGISSVGGGGKATATLLATISSPSASGIAKAIAPTGVVLSLSAIFSFFTGVYNKTRALTLSKDEDLLF